MDPAIFRKEDARSCLVVDKSMKDVLNPPANIALISDRIGQMIANAKRLGLLTSKSTLAPLKTAVNEILLDPLRYNSSQEMPVIPQKSSNILTDAFWDEIAHSGTEWSELLDQIQHAINMKTSIDEHSPLENSATLGTIKENFNETVIDPMSYQEESI